MINYTPPTKHTSLFYNSQEEYLDIVVPYLKAGLENNELCTWVVPETLKIEDAQEYLNKVSENLNSYLEKEQLLIKGHQDFYLKDGVFSAYRTIDAVVELEKKALKKGFKGMRGTGDCSWALDACWFSFLMYEKELNKVIEEYKIRALCSYSIPALDLKKIRDIGTSHQSSLVRQTDNWNRLDSQEFEKVNI
ncbi:MAG: MEDS domain-containing protein [Candidatus Omnitrophota bacterium]